MKLVNSVTPSYVDFNACSTKVTTATHTTRPARQIPLCSHLKSLSWKSCVPQTPAAERGAGTTLCGRCTIKISWVPSGLQRVLVSENSYGPTFDKTKHSLAGSTPAPSPAQRQHSLASPYLSDQRNSLDIGFSAFNNTHSAFAWKRLPFCTPCLLPDMPPLAILTITPLALVLRGSPSPSCRPSFAFLCSLIFDPHQISFESIKGLVSCR